MPMATQQDSINVLTDNGYSAFASDAVSVCGGQSTQNVTGGDLWCRGDTTADDSCTTYYDDSWGFIDFQCIESGYFHIDILPSPLPDRLRLTSSAA